MGRAGTTVDVMQLEPPAGLNEIIVHWFMYKSVVCYLSYSIAVVVSEA